MAITSILIKLIGDECWIHEQCVIGYYLAAIENDFSNMITVVQVRPLVNQRP